MIRTLRRLYWIGMQLEKCGGCGKLMRAGVVRKETPNKGKMFQRCRNKQCEKPGFAWIVEKEKTVTNA